MRRLVQLLIIYSVCVSCITDDFATDNTPTAAFEVLWQTLDEHYCFFDYKDIDWQSVHDRYAPLISDTMSRAAVFDTLSRMTYELRDGHVNLISSMNVSRYGAWFDDHPMNFSDSLLRKTLGRAEDYRSAGGMQYRILAGDSIGYVRVGSFETQPSVTAMSEMLMSFKDCPALIIDIRSNGGGLLTAAEALASSFIKERILAGYMQYKTGRGHSDFSTPEPIYIDPSEGVKWIRPVAILTNRRTYSAANAFVMFLKEQQHVILVGDDTGGGSGLPFTAELPYGWGIRFSASPMLDAQKQHTEWGIAPDIRADITPTDYQKSEDSILKTARLAINRWLKPHPDKTSFGILPPLPE